MTALDRHIDQMCSEATPTMRKEILKEYSFDEFYERLVNLFRLEDENKQSQIEQKELTQTQKELAQTQKELAQTQKELSLVQKELAIADKAKALTQKNIVLNANKEGVPIEMIMKITGLTHEEVEKIINTNIQCM